MKIFDRIDEHMMSETFIFLGNFVPSRTDNLSMLISLNWLRTLSTTNLDADAISDLLTNSGLEVEKSKTIQSVKGGLAGLVVGEVLTCDAHPNADRLKITTVNIGEEKPLQIVCGAPNVAAGQKVIVAPVGTTIHPLSGDPFEIRKAKIRGESSSGMICAEDEIGLGTNHDGILVLDGAAQVGSKAADLFSIETDVQYEIGLTPNRGDGASHLGVARDIYAVKGHDVIRPEVPSCKSPNASTFKIQVDHEDGCPRYSGIVLNDVEVKESPDWLQQRLKSIDLKPINNVVDVTNFVLHELGQPIHAFDADKIDGDTIFVRSSVKGEKFKTLDEVERTLTGEEMMIADKSKGLAIAGVFGGHHSGVTGSTKRLFIESAYFDMSVVRKSAKAQGLSTDASFRYERGCDPEITVYAMQRVVGLLQEVAGAKIESAMVDHYPAPLEDVEISVDMKWLNTFCGTDISSDEASTILERLDFTISSSDDTGLVVKAPRYRSDVTRNVDVAEEILRIYGYNKVEIPSRLAFTPAVQDDKNKLKLENRIANYLIGQGLLEIMNNSQTREEFATENAVKMINPLSQELAVMRTSLQPAMLDSIAYNLNRKNSDLHFFEFGKTYFKTDRGFSEQNCLMIASTGDVNQVNWTTAQSPTDYFRVKGWIEGLALILGISANKILKKANICEIDKKTLKTHGIKQPVYIAEINLDAVHALWSKARFNLEDVPVFPVVIRDLSLVMDKETAFDDVKKIITNQCGHLLQDVSVFDVYRGDRIPKGKKAYACSIKLYDPKKTLTDQEVDTVINKVVHTLQSKFQIELRS